MADEEHLAILRQGVEAWNAWCQENPTIRPDLHRANSSGPVYRRRWRGYGGPGGSG
jgi:hypothetical protein